MTPTDWSTLEDALGPATEIPSLVRALASSGGRARARALDQLWARLCNQGAASPAALPAVPLLFDLLAAPRVKDKHEILGLLIALVMGDHTNFLDGSMSPARRQAKRKRSRKSRALDCGTAVSARLGEVRALLGDRDARVRGAAAFVLAWFADPGGRTKRALAAQASKERDVAAKASMLIALGHLGATAARPLIHAGLERGASVSPVHAGAAIACVYLDGREASPRAREVLDAAAASKALAKTAQPWNGGDLAGLAALLLARWPTPTRKRSSADVDLSVLDALGAMPFLRAETAALRLFAKAFPQRKIRFDALTDVQRRILVAFTEQGIGSMHGPLSHALHAKGLPMLYDLAKPLGVKRGRHPRFDELLMP